MIDADRFLGEAIERGFRLYTTPGRTRTLNLLIRSYMPLISQRFTALDGLK